MPSADQFSPWLTAAITVIGGTAVYVSSQVVQRFFLDPIHDQRKTIGEIANALLFLGNIAYAHELRDKVQFPAAPEEASRTLRGLAARLRASLWLIPAYGFWAALHLVPKRDAVLTASKHLVGWSNSLGEGQPGTHRDALAKVLNLPSG